MQTMPQDKDLGQVMSDVDELTEVLALEFDALKSRQMDALADLNLRKDEILNRLQPHTDSFMHAQEVSERWVIARDRLLKCRDMHFKNVQLLRRQLDAVQGALQALMGQDNIQPGLYDRLGQVNRPAGVRAYQAI